MRHIYYTGGQVLTGDRTCKAVLRYARALAEAGTSDVVTIPVLSEGGSKGSAHLLIGPASQIFSVPVPESVDEPFDQSAINRLEEQTRRLQPSRPEWPDEMTDIGDLDYT
jgi:hypothetical protein